MLEQGESAWLQHAFFLIKDTKATSKGVARMSAEQTNNNVGLTNEEISALKGLASLARLSVVQEDVAGAAYHDDENESVDLIDMFWFLLYKLKYVVLVALICALLGGVYGYKIVKPEYSSTAKLYILGQSKTSIEISSLQLGSMLTMDYQEVFKTWEVHEMVRTALNLDYSYNKMQSMLSVTNPSSTRVLYITVRNTDPELAAEMANMYATAGRQFIMQTMDAEQPSMFSIALVPGTSVGRSRSTYVVFGFAIGALLMLVIFVLMYLLDDRPKSAEDILKHTGMTTLGTIPVMDQAVKTENKQKRRKSK